MTEIQTIFEFIKSGGALAALVLILYLLMSGRLRFSREVEHVEEDRRFYRDRVLPIIERQQDILEELKRSVDSRNR